MATHVRRNGQLSSCEPCRKSKLRCDHQRPICSRCIRRRFSEQQCHYHPAPMARTGRTPRTPVSSTPSSQPISASELRPSTPEATDSQPHELVNLDQDLMRFADPSTVHPRRTYTTLGRTSVALPAPCIPSTPMVAEGVDLLNGILDLVLEIGPDILDRFLDEIQLCGSDALGIIAWKATAPTLRWLLDNRTASGLEPTSRGLFEQTSRAVAFPPSAADGALEATFSGEFLRWELIGIFCAEIGVVLSDERDRIVNYGAEKRQAFDRKVMMQRIFQYCLQCETFCVRLGAVNDWLLWFVMITILLATWCFGDDSYHVFRLHGNMTSIFLALGYQKGAQHLRATPLYLVELRKKAIAWAHDDDKVCATFTSRAPRLSRHFCTMEMPLDIPDEVLVQSESVIRAAIAELDDGGWSKTAPISNVARLRIGVLLCPIREEALELRSSSSPADARVRARQALSKLASAWQTIPRRYRYETATQSAFDADIHGFLAFIRLDYFYTEFLIRSVLADEGQAERDQLIRTAHEVLHLVILHTRKKSFIDERRSDTEWTLVFFAMPCASVLVLELLRQAQRPQEHSILNRSSIIQDISVLIACCDSLSKSGQNNYSTCKQAQVIFSQSLDSILNCGESVSNVPVNERPKTQVQSRLNEPLDPDLAGMSTGDEVPDWSAWLESVGLQAEPWFDAVVPSLNLPANFGVDETVQRLG